MRFRVSAKESTEPSPSTKIRDALEYLKKTWQDESVITFGGRKFQIGDKKEIDKVSMRVTGYNQEEYQESIENPEKRLQRV